MLFVVNIHPWRSWHSEVLFQVPKHSTVLHLLVKGNPMYHVRAILGLFLLSMQPTCWHTYKHDNLFTSATSQQLHNHPQELESSVTLLLEPPIWHEVTLLLRVTVVCVFECCDMKMCDGVKMALNGWESSIWCSDHFFLRGRGLYTQWLWVWCQSQNEYVGKEKKSCMYCEPNLGN